MKGRLRTWAPGLGIAALLAFGLAVAFSMRAGTIPNTWPLTLLLIFIGMAVGHAGAQFIRRLKRDRQRRQNEEMARFILENVEIHADTADFEMRLGAAAGLLGVPLDELDAMQEQRSGGPKTADEKQHLSDRSG